MSDILRTNELAMSDRRDKVNSDPFKAIETTLREIPTSGTDTKVIEDALESLSNNRARLISQAKDRVEAARGSGETEAMSTEEIVSNTEFMQGMSYLGVKSKVRGTNSFKPEDVVAIYYFDLLRGTKDGKGHPVEPSKQLAETVLKKLGALGEGQSIADLKSLPGSQDDADPEPYFSDMLGGHADNLPTNVEGLTVKVDNINTPSYLIKGYITPKTLSELLQ